GVDPYALAHRRQLLLALNRASQVEADVPGNELARGFERAIIADRHHVIEPVDAHPFSSELVRKPVSGPLGEHLLLDQGRSMLADIARLAREDDRRLAVAR